MGIFNVSKVAQTPKTTGDRQNQQKRDANIEQLFATEIFDAVNEYREQNRLQPVVRFHRIDELCLEHCLYMYKNNDFSHANWDSARTSRGELVREELVLKLGFTKTTENLASEHCYPWQSSAHCYPWQFSNPQERELIVREKMLGSWLGSPEYRGNIKMGSHTHSGICAIICPPTAEYPDYVQCFVTQIFAS